MKKIIKIIIFIIIIASIVAIVYFNMGLKAVSDDSSVINYTVENGNTYYSVIKDLKNKGLIKNELCFKIYIKINNVEPIKAGTYSLRKNMSVSEIVEAFTNNKTVSTLSITFKEGRNMRSVAELIENNTKNTYEDVLNVLKDTEYIKSLIDEYWFISDEVLEKNIYYPLEGYLYPDTYYFDDENVDIKQIFKSMLDNMKKNLEPYKDKILNGSYTPHQILTLASVIELEGASLEDRKLISGVFYNRIQNNQNLGSDVTTYYAAKVDMSERDLTVQELNSNNPYNTRNANMAGKLPIGPICNPSISSIESAIEPTSSDYLYFVADKNKKVYFTKTYSEHLNTRDKLIKAGLWYTY